MTAGPRFDHYDWAGGREAMLRFGPDRGPVAVMALPLFEEANRTRAFGGAILRELAARGIGGVLPDMPGQGDSLVPLETLSLLQIQAGYAAVADLLAGRDQRPYGIGLRSGALLDTAARLHGRWHLAPQGGPDLLRELRRTRQASVRGRLGDAWYADADLPGDAEDASVEIAGNRLSTVLLNDLTMQQPRTGGEDGGPLRVVRLAGDPGAADRHLPGQPLWRRAEPAADPALAVLIADDIAGWIARCEG